MTYQRRDLQPDLVASDGQLRRIKHLWEETRLSVRTIASSVVLPERRVERLIKAHPDWKPRTRMTLENGMQALYEMLVLAAQAHEPCPTDQQIGLHLGISKMHAQNIFTNLVKTGRIQTQRMVQKQGTLSSFHRVVILIDLKLRTRHPQQQDAWYSKQQVDIDKAHLEAAKNFVRSLGPTTYDAKVKYPMRTGIMVDNDYYEREDFLAYAYRRGFCKS